MEQKAPPTPDDEETARLRRDIRAEIEPELKVSGMKPVTFGIVAGFLISLPAFLLLLYVLFQNGLTDIGGFFNWIYNCVRGYCAGS